MMGGDEDTIAEVGIDHEGGMYVRPSSMLFEHIYRAAMEVHWDSSKSRLYGGELKGDWTFVDWFKQIVAAVADEYGVRLRLNPETVWSNVSPALRDEIVSVAQG